LKSIVTILLLEYRYSKNNSW